MRRNRILLALPVLAIALVGALVFDAKIDRGEPTPASTATTSPGILEDLGLPQGPFDDVLKAPADHSRTSPPRNKVVNDPAGENDGVVQSEVSVQVNGDEVVVGWNDGQGFVSNVTVSGYGYSNDRGETWTDGGEVPDGPGTAVFGDPTVIVTDSGQWVFVSLDQGSTLGLAVSRGRFQSGSLDWDPALKFVDANGFLDKEYIEYDSATNRIYMTYANLSQGQGKIVRSEDEGLTWSSPLSVNTASSNGYYPAPGVDGEVYVTWVQPLFSANANMYIRHSPDGGSSWSGSRILIAQTGPDSDESPRCFNRGVNITWPSAAVDRSDGPHRGRVYAVYSDGGANSYNTYLRYSDDKALTWSDATQLNDNENDATSEQFWPQVFVGPNGRVTVGWYDRRNETSNNSLCDFYVTQSVDGGKTWGPNRRMSDTSVAWCGVPANINPNFGDYVETICDERSVFSVWSDARNGDPDVIFSRRDDVQTLDIVGAVGDGNANFQENGTAWFIPNEAELTISPVPALDGEAELLVLTTAFGLLASPQETDGLYQIAEGDLTGELTIAGEGGSVDGTFEIRNAGPNDIDLAFDADLNGSLIGLDLPTELVMDLTVVAGDTDLDLFGTIRLTGLGQQPADFSVSGQVRFENLATLENSHRFEQTGRLLVGADLLVHTRTLVTDGVVVDVPDLTLGENPPPLALLRVSPNPWTPESQVRLNLSHEATGTIQVYSADGRMVRKLFAGNFQPGDQALAFDGKDDHGRDLPTGGYFLRLQSDAVNAAGKMFMVR